MRCCHSNCYNYKGILSEKSQESMHAGHVWDLWFHKGYSYLHFIWMKLLEINITQRISTFFLFLMQAIWFLVSLFQLLLCFTWSMVIFIFLFYFLHYSYVRSSVVHIVLTLIENIQRTEYNDIGYWRSYFHFYKVGSAGQICSSRCVLSIIADTYTRKKQ